MHPLFDFTRSERRAILLLMFLTFAVAVWRFCLSEEKMSPVPFSAPETPVFSTADSLSRKVVGDTKTVLLCDSIEKKKKRLHGDTVLWFDLNNADSLALQRVSGLGPVLSARIVKYRNLLGGFCNVEQLREVYGIDEARYRQIKPCLRVVEPIKIVRIAINEADYKTLLRHPYLKNEQVKRIWALRKEKKIESWNELSEYEEFGDSLILKLTPYFHF